tara:strand:+ start:5084 stop:5617 length:534 start_codon:yes stop_codon:yes gene_type:complete
MRFIPKDLDVGFVVLCTDNNIGLLKNTVRSLNIYYPKKSCIAVVARTTATEDIDEMKELCPIYRGKGTVTSLINTGLRNGNKEWNLLTVAGAWFKGCEVKKMSVFVENEYDIVYPCVDKMRNFYEATINGLMIHRKAFKKVGPFCDENPLEICRLMWMLDAIEAGCKFKAVLGPNIC